MSTMREESQSDIRAVATNQENAIAFPAGIGVANGNAIIGSKWCTTCWPLANYAWFLYHGNSLCENCFVNLKEQDRTFPTHFEYEAAKDTEAEM